LNACPLTSRERVNRMFERRDHDRVPRHDQYWPETVTRWQAEGLAGGAAEMLEALGSDLAGIGWSWPAPYREETVIEENETTLVKRDRFGRLGRWWKGRSGTPEHLGFECETRSIWEEKLKPMFLAGGPDNDPGALRKTWRGARERGKWVHLTGVEPFELLRAMLGDETMAIAMASEPDWIVDIAVTFTDQALAEYQRCLDAGMDAVLPKPFRLDDLESLVENWLPPPTRERPRPRSSTEESVTDLISREEVEAVRRSAAQPADP